MNNEKRVALYLRVSTDGQTTENQRLELERIAELSGWKIIGTYEDHAISGAKGHEKRPALDNLLKDANRRKFDLVAAWSVDRLGRSLQNLLEFLAELQRSVLICICISKGPTLPRPPERRCSRCAGFSLSLSDPSSANALVLGWRGQRRTGKGWEGQGLTPKLKRPSAMLWAEKTRVCER